jgi:hypothetical protein
VLVEGEAYGRTAKLLEPVPVIVGVPLKLNVVVPLLVTVTVAFFVTPCTTVPKAIVAGERLTSVLVPVSGSTADELPDGSPVNEAATVPA